MGSLLHHSPALPYNFEWVRKLVQSEAMKIIKGTQGVSNYLTYAIPAACPTEAKATCQLLHPPTMAPTEAGHVEVDDGEEHNEENGKGQNNIPEENHDEEASPGNTTPLAKVTATSTSQLYVKHKKVQERPIVETDVRRSDRLKNTNIRFQKQDLHR